MEEQETDRVGQFAARLTGQDEAETSASEQASGYRTMGAIMAIIGLLVAGYALFGYEVTAPYSDTLNIGLLNEQLMLSIIGCTLFLAGTITFAVGGIIRRL